MNSEQIKYFIYGIIIGFIINKYLINRYNIIVIKR